ncbi:MAG: type II toxin-antitoxin system RelE/ParE family toxin [Sphingomonadales bacterium]|nr:type II toxin-antitoxin system RelE/ParE family toxin [Sphingomonadales bacterium]
MQTVIETPGFARDAKAAGVTDAERGRIVETIAANPLAGAEIAGTGGARKVRFARQGGGKSGGYRVITYFGGVDIPVFLLNVFAKGDKATLSAAEVNELKAILARLAMAYREGVQRNAEVHKPHP